MKVLQINESFNNNHVKDRKNSNINFKAYNIKVLENDIKLGNFVNPSIIKEVHADSIKLRKSSNFDNNMQSGVLSTLVIGLLAVSKWNLWGRKAELEMKISLQKAKLLIAKSEEEENEISQLIIHYKDLIAQINRQLTELTEIETSINISKLEY